MSRLFSLLAPTHPIGLLVLFPLLAIWVNRAGGTPWLRGLTAVIVLAISVWALTLREPVPSLAYFSLTLAAPAVCIAVTVAALQGRHWTGPAVYLGALVAGILAWFAGLILALAVLSAR